jgi:hypothetical protein
VPLDNASFRVGCRAVQQNGYTQPTDDISARRHRLIAGIRLTLTRQPRHPVPPMAFASPVGTSGHAEQPLMPPKGQMQIAHEMNRRIRTAHGLGDTPPLLRHPCEMSHGRLLTKAVQRQSDCQSCGSGSAPAVARSRRVTRQQHLLR